MLKKNVLVMKTRTYKSEASFALAPKRIYFSRQQTSDSQEWTLPFFVWITGSGAAAKVEAVNKSRITDNMPRIYGLLCRKMRHAY
jgi:hypothetical protein